MDNKSKFNTYLFNFILCLPVWVGVYFVLSVLQLSDSFDASIIVICFYVMDVKYESEIEILTDRIKKLEESQTQK